MTLDPGHYECPDHHTDLTPLVQKALEEQGPPLAYQPPLGKPTPAARRFQVIVTCPGTSAAPAHQLSCTGTRTP